MKQILAIIMMLTSACATAQIYSSEACFYIEAGKNVENTEYVAVLLFKGENLYVFNSYGVRVNEIMFKKKCGGIKNKGTSYEWGGVMDYLKANPKYYDNLQNQNLNPEKWSYDESLSTSKRKVYKHFNPAINSDYWLSTPEYTTYLAVSQDKSSIIQWNERNGEIMGKKTYYVRVDKEQLLPKAINRDFLYE